MDKKNSILVVDDEPSGFDVIEGILFGENYELHYASSGAAAIKRIETVLLDLILLDVMMPDMDGIEVCRWIKTSSAQHIPVIMVTALSSKVVLARCLETGADDFIDKPVNPLELRARVRSMLRIKKQHDALQASLQLRQDMSDMVIHDLRNPLTSIILSCAILKRTELQGMQQHKVEQILQAGQQLQSMIDSLLLMAKLEADRLVLERSSVDLCELAQQSLADFRAIALAKQIDLISDFPSHHQSVYVDEALLRRVLDNLLSNAIKFSSYGSQVTLRISFSSTQRVRIEVADQGKGIKAELRQSIFDKYEVGDCVNGVAQMGLGLAFCKMAIEAHGGKIFVEENQPTGAILVVEI
ncbi:MAG: hybrid sensor histidine kinase/response regulator [Drouetiella hepatica Uher 2000/2452]|uniref:histidine kinase n=1 Tax=Drouetiella hepatica Uher 2000/2452 TaxID=904376 RepID=A0A951UK51_9CYAN|nr:hybrid sensor histidine kinase/response regulator [Drouetiella hepatica Uher 2000/2452]